MTAVREHRDFLNDMPEYSVVLEDTQDAARSQIRERPSRLLEDAKLLHLRTDAPLAARLASLDERREEIVATADRVQLLGRRHGRRLWCGIRFGVV